MARMRYWAVTIPVEQYEHERLHAGRRFDLAEAGQLRPGDWAVLVAATTPPVIFAFGRVIGFSYGKVTSPLSVVYHRRLFEGPLRAADLPAAELPASRSPGLREIDEDAFAKIRAAVGDPPARKSWMVSVDLPIEAGSPREAVAQFWTYLRELGPTELPTFVSPVGDELAMQAYVLGEETNLDPEEE